MKKDNMRPKDVNTEAALEEFPDISATASTGECTGLMYATPRDEEENEAYKDIYSMQIPKEKKD